MVFNDKPCRQCGRPTAIAREGGRKINVCLYHPRKPDPAAEKRLQRAQFAEADKVLKNFSKYLAEKEPFVQAQLAKFEAQREAKLAKFKANHSQ